MRARYDLAVDGALVLTMDPRCPIVHRGRVLVAGNRIAWVGPAANAPGEAEEVVGLEQGLVMPGLVNAHTHEVLTRGVCEDLPLMRWLEEICFPLDRSYTEEDMRAAALLNQLEMIAGGVTTFLDIYRLPHVCAEVLERSGLRGVLSPQIVDLPEKSAEDLEYNRWPWDTWHGKGGGRIHVWVGVHAPYSCLPSTYREAYRLARELGVGLHTHLSETEDEVRMMHEREGKSPVAYLRDLGVLGPWTVVAHATHLSREDMGELASRGVKVVHNPTSNMKLASGVAPVPEMLEAGLTVALGTDSNLSNNNLDMFEEMRMAALLQKLARRDAAVMPCHRVLEMATLGGARALGLEGEIGSLEPGKKADLIVVDLDRPHLHPLLTGEVSNVVEHLVYSASAADVDTTVVDGRVLMRHRRVLTLDAPAVMREADQRARDLCRRAGIGRDG